MYSFALFERWGNSYQTTVPFGMKQCFHCEGVCIEIKRFKISCFVGKPCNIEHKVLVMYLEEQRKKTGGQYADYTSNICSTAET